LTVLAQLNPATMSSLEIAELVESRHDDVKRSIERLAERGVIQLPPLAEVKNHKGQSVKVYQVRKRDSFIVVAQLSPEFTARLVDRWQELENKDQPVIPKNYPEALKLAYEQALVIEDQSRRLVEKDNLILAGNEASIKAGEILVREFVKVKVVDIFDLGEKLSLATASNELTRLSGSPSNFNSSAIWQSTLCPFWLHPANLRHSNS
jgi:phage regulator Rha-like protein